MFRHAESSREKDALCSCSGYVTEVPNEGLKMGSLLIIAYKSRRLIAVSVKLPVNTPFCIQTALNKEFPAQEYETCFYY